MWVLKGEGEPFVKEEAEPPKPAILLEFEKMAKTVAIEAIAEQEQDFMKMKIQLENLIQEKEYAEQEKRLANVETRQQELENLYKELYDLYYNTPALDKPRKAIIRGMGAKGVLTEKTGTMYPDGNFIEDTQELGEKEMVYCGKAVKEVREELSDTMVRLPVAENLAAGIPVEAVDVYDTYPVPAHLLPNKHKKYCVAKIHGTSMTEAGISDGSYVLLEYTAQPVNGKNMVVKYGSNTTLKLLHRDKKGGWELLYQDGSGAKIILENGDWEVKGLFICVL